MSDLLELINTALDRTPKSAAPLYASCTRKMWFAKRKASQVKVNNLHLDLKAVFEGVYVHHLKELGLSVAKVGQYHIARSDAGIFSLLWIDLMRSDIYKGFLKGGIDPNAEWKIREALDTVKGANNELDNSIYVGINRDTYDQTIIVVDKDAGRLSFMRDNMANADVEELPAVFEGHHCNWCQFKAVCKGDEWPEINCGTCANVSVDDGCLSCPFGSEKCDKHLYHPQLMALKGFDLVNADQANLRLNYGTIVNATASDSEGVPSEKIRELF